MPHAIDLETAIYEISTAYVDRGHAQPFFFVVGAGISAPTVPLAREIIEHCRGRVAHLDHAGAPPPAPGVLDAYSYWFDRAYPQPADRQRYLRSLIHNKPLSDASLRLAHILASQKLASLVVTPNFDDFISRALNVFGVTHAVSDHPDTVDRIDLASEDIKIVHVHGSYKFYDCRNLREEVELRAQPSVRTTRTMAAFLDRALSFSSPLVIGYGGWEDDVVMSALRRRIEGASLPYRLYWFAYRAQEVADLAVRAPWLTDHPDVRLIAPTDSVTPATEPNASGGRDDAPVLTAQDVLEALSRGFDVGEPEITRDPVGFFARQLRATLLHETDPTRSGGIYSFTTVVARLERAAELEAHEFAARKPGDSPQDLEDVRRLLRESKYADAIHIADAIADRIGATERAELFALLDAAGNRGELPNDVELTRADLLLRIAAGTPAIRSAADYPERHIKYLLDKGQALYYDDQAEEAVVVFNEIIDTYGDAASDTLAKLVRYAQSRKALALAKSGQIEEAISLYEGLIPQLKEGEEWLVTQSAFNRATYLRSVAKSSEALTALEEFVDARLNATDGWTQVLVAAALEEAAEIRADEGNMDGAILDLNKLIAIYGDTHHDQVARVVTRALLRLAALDIDTGDKSAALRALDRFRLFAARVPLPKEMRVTERHLRREAAEDGGTSADN